MSPSTIPADVRRFILTSIPSVPHLEALLLLHNEPGTPWTSARLAQRLYVSEKIAGTLLQELSDAAIVESVGQPGTFQYAPRTKDLAGLIDRLAITYSKHLVEITHLIHSKTDRKAQQFADAFRLRKKDP